MTKRGVARSESAAALMQATVMTASRNKSMTGTSQSRDFIV
jgi:hypothetical protein